MLRNGGISGISQRYDAVQQGDCSVYMHLYHCRDTWHSERAPVTVKIGHMIRNNTDAWQCMGNACVNEKHGKASSIVD